MSFLRGVGSPRSKVEEHVDGSKQSVKKLKHEIRRMASKARGPDPPKILFMGETGSGKSSFISSIVSALSGKIIYTSTVGEKEGHEVNTSKRYLEHRVFIDEDDSKEGRFKKKKDGDDVSPRNEEFPLNFVLCDSRGLAKRLQHGAADEEIERLIDGKLRHGDLIEDERSYDGTRISERKPSPPSCVVFVQKAQRLGEVDQDVREKLHRGSTLVRERGIPSCVVLTHVDQIKKGLESKPHTALLSTKVQERVKTAAHDAGVNENRVFVVKNYTHEAITQPSHDTLILRALRGILVDAEQKDRDTIERLRRSCPPSLPFGPHIRSDATSSVFSSTAPQSSSTAYSGPSTSVSRQWERDKANQAEAPRLRRSQRDLNRSSAAHQRQTSAPSEMNYKHVEAVKKFLPSEELPKQIEYHIRQSPTGSEDETTSDKLGEFSQSDSGFVSMQMTPYSLLQDHMNRLQSPIFPEQYSDRASLRGAKPLYRPVVYQHSDVNLNSAEDIELRHQLKKEKSQDDFYLRIKADLQMWAGAETAGALWMSDTLPMDFSLPIDQYLPDSIDAQALVLAPDLPPFLLTIYDPERIHENSTESEQNAKLHIQEERERIADLTVTVSKLLTTALFNYCHCDFILLPVCVEYKDLCPDSLDKEIKKQQDETRMYYGGPRLLTRGTYSELKAAADAVCGVSHVPTLLQADPDRTEVKQRLSSLQDAEEQLYLLDPTWQGTVSLLVEHLTRVEQGQTTRISFRENTYFKMLVAVMEAAKRLSFVDDVVVVARDVKMQGCCRRLKEKVLEETGMELTLRVMTPQNPDTQGAGLTANILILIDLPDFQVASDVTAVLYLEPCTDRFAVTV